MAAEPTYVQLKEKVRLLETLIENSGGLMGLYDKNGTLLITNKLSAAYWGGKPDDFIGKSMEDLFPKSAEIIMPRFRETFKSGKPASYEDQFRIFSGTKWLHTDYIPIFNENNEVYAVQIITIDITNEKESDNALKETEEIFSQFMEHNPIYVFFKDENIRSIRLSRNYEKMLGMPIDEILGKTMDEIFPSDLAKGMIEDDKRVLGEGKLITVEEELNGRFYETIKFPIIIEGKAKYLAGYTIDMTDRKRGEEERRLLQQRLQQSLKMESLGTLAGGIAHDFNNILFPILAHSELAMMTLPSDSPVQQNVQQIHKAGERAKDMVHQILTFARQQENKRTPIKISPILKDIVKLLRSSIPSTISMQCNINIEQDIVLADLTQINQIIMNLCTNAVHAMEDQGGSLEIILTNEKLDSESVKKFTELEPCRYIKLTVRDTGHGILPELTDKIFEPYFTTKGPGKGTGMGLSIVHGIVKNYGGEIIVQSKVNQGTSFNVYLPLLEVDSNVHEDAQDLGKFPKGTERILIVDDEKVAVDTLKSVLEWLGYKVTGRTSSIEALEAFRHNPKGFDLVITDYTMPNMTGKILVKEMISIRQDIPVILCTGFSEQIDEKKAKAMGVRAFLMKPVVMGQIAKTIREVLDKDG